VSSFPQSSTKTHKLRISWSSIRSNPILRKSALRVDPPRLIKPHPLIAHDLLDFALTGIVETGAGVSGGNVPREVEGAGREAGFHVCGEGGGEARVDVGGPRDRMREGGEDGKPVGAGEVEDGGEEE